MVQLGVPAADLLGDDHAVIGGIFQAGVQGIELSGGAGDGVAAARAALQLYEFPWQGAGRTSLQSCTRPRRHKIKPPFCCILQLQRPHHLVLKKLLACNAVISKPLFVGNLTSTLK